MPRSVNERTRAWWSQLGQSGRQERTRVTVLWDYDQPDRRSLNVVAPPNFPDPRISSTVGKRLENFLQTVVFHMELVCVYTFRVYGTR